MDPTIFFFISMLILSVAGIGSRFIPGWKPDNKIEEFAEKVIEKETGRSIDLSPDTPDPDDGQLLSKEEKPVKKG